MSNSTLKMLLTEYEQKRMSTLLNFDRKKEELYSSSPRLKEIDDELNSFAINTAKSILNSNDSHTSLQSLEKKIKDLKKEKEGILKSLNAYTTYYCPMFECTNCEDTGYIKTNNGYELCPCIKQKLFDIEYNKSNISDLKNHNFKNFQLDLYSDQVNEELYNSNISPRDNIKNIKAIVDSFIENFDNPDEKNLLFLRKYWIAENLFYLIV